MSRTRPVVTDANQLPLFALSEVQFVPIGDGNYRTVKMKPVIMASVREAARLTGEKRKVIYNLYHAGIVEGEKRTPRKIVINMESLHAHLKGSRDAEYWDSTKTAAYRRTRTPQK